ncbi:MAG TPA: response regulator [Chromatiales bacterium]|nr:response regulator [Chromatiales bacterium]
MIRVLLVDDHELVRTGIRRILDDAPDMEIVAEAGSGEEAIRRAVEHKPDIVLMDVRMPGMGGIEATRRLQRSLPDAGIIALTAIGNEPFPTQLHNAGAMGYLTKSCPAEEVLAAIRTVHEGELYVASEVAKQQVLSGWRKGEQSPFESLSSREMQVALMVLEGLKNQEISDKLSLSPKTVSTYRQRIFEKLGVKTDVDMTRLAYRYGVINEVP